MSVAVLLLLAHVVCAWIATQHFLRPRRLLLLPLYTLLTAFTFFYGFSIVLCWITGIIRTVLLAATLIPAAALAAVAYRRNPEPAYPLREVLAGAKRFGLAGWLLVALCGFGFFCLALVASVVPMRWADAVKYHSLQPMYWAETHRFDFGTYGDTTRISDAGAGEVFPNAKGLLAFVVMDVTGRQYGTGAVQIPFLVVFMVALFVLYRLLELPHWIAALGVAFSLAIPEVMMNSMEGYADICIASGIYSIVALLCFHWREGIRGRELLPLASAFAIAVSSKPFALLTCGVLGVWLLVVALFGGEAAPWKARIRLAFLSVGVVVLFCLFTGGPWYIHGILKYRNPVYPVQVKYHDKEVLPGILTDDVATSMAAVRLGATGPAAYWKVLLEAYRPGIVSPWTGSFGAHAFVLGVPSLLIFLLYVLNIPEERRRYLPVLLVFGSLVFATGSMLIPRYNFFHVAAAGLGFLWIVHRAPWLLRIPLVLAFLALAAYNVARVVPSLMFRPRPAEVMAHSFLTGDYRNLLVDGFPGELRGADIWKETAPAGSFLGYRDIYAFTLWPENGTSHIAEMPSVAEVQDDEAAWAAAVRGSGANYALFFLDSPEARAALAHPETFELIFRGDNAVGVSHMMLVSRPADVLFRVLGRGEGAKP